MKRGRSATRSSRPSSRSRSAVRRSRPSSGSGLSVYRSPTKGYGFLTRSNFYDIPINGSSHYYVGLGCNATGYLVTQDSNVVNTGAWAGASDISSGWDAYKITKMEVTVSFNQNTSTVNSYQGTLPFMYWCHDYNDINTSSSSASEILQRVDAQQVVLGRNSKDSYDLKHSFQPKCAQLAYATSVASGYLEPKSGQWISTSPGISGAFTDVQHYGMKLFVDATKMTDNNTIQIGELRIFIKAFFSVKDPY